MYDDTCCVIILTDLQRQKTMCCIRLKLKKVDLQKVQLCLEDQRHQGVPSGPVTEGEKGNSLKIVRVTM